MRFQSKANQRQKRFRLTGRALMYFVPLAVVVCGVMLALYWLGAYSLAAEVEVASRRLLDKHMATLRCRLQTASEDVRLLAEEAGRLGVFDRSHDADESIAALTASVVRNRKAYQCVRIVDVSGRETLRMEFTARGGRFVGGPELIARQPWAKIGQVLSLSGQQVCLLEADQDVVPSVEGPESPSITMATPIYDADQQQRGAVVLEYRPSSLFGDIAAEVETRRVMLIDPSGARLCDPSQAAFDATSPQAWNWITERQAGRVYTARGLFVFQTIDPLVTINEAVAPSGEAGDGVSSQAVWKLVGHVPTGNLPSRNMLRRTLFGSSLTVMLILLAAGSWRLAHFSRMRNDAEKTLRRARRSAEFANASKTQFLANMSHEIRTPMTAVLGYTNLLMDPDLPHEERSECLRTLQRNGEHLLTLINDVLDISRIEAGKLNVKREPVNLMGVIAEVVSMMRIRASQRKLELTVSYLTEMPETILSDGARVRQTLINLVGNAVKFTEVGQIRVIGRLLPAWRTGGAVQVDVMDTGVGIEPEHLERIFQPFAQADVSGRRLSGSGLGLAISRSIIKMLGGELTAASSPGDGSTFTVVIPTGDLTGVRMLSRPSEAAAGPDALAPIRRQALKGLWILLAEDGPDNQRLIRTFLARSGALVDTADNGADALAQVQTQEYDVIFMDMQMPEMDGFEAVGRLRAAGITTPVVALTAHALAGDRDRCIEAGCTDYLTKPIDRNRLIETALRYADKASVAADATAVESPEVILTEVPDSDDLSDLIDEFVDGLPRTVAAMTDSLIHAQFDQLSLLAHRLRGSGGGFGYPALTDAAAAVEDAATAEDPETASMTMMILIAVCQAISRGRKATMPV